MKPKNTICLWYEKDAAGAAKFYAETFPDSAVTAVHTAPSDFPDGKEGDVLTVEFTVMGIPCIGINRRPTLQPRDAIPFQNATADQEEANPSWHTTVDQGGQSSQRRLVTQPSRVPAATPPNPAWPANDHLL